MRGLRRQASLRPSGYGGPPTLLRSVDGLPVEAAEPRSWWAMTKLHHALTPRTIREGRAALVLADVEEVRQRIDLRRLHVGIGRQIGGRVEADRRVAALVPARRIVVIERIDT